MKTTEDQKPPVGVARLVRSGDSPPVGIESYLLSDDGRADKFQCEEMAFAFPCCACTHVRGPREFCEGCRHYAL